MTKRIVQLLEIIPSIAPAIVIIVLMVFEKLRETFELDGWWDWYWLFLVGALIFLSALPVVIKRFRKILLVLSLVAIVILLLVYGQEFIESNGNYALVITKQEGKLGKADLVYGQLEKIVEDFNKWCEKESARIGQATCRKMVLQTRNIPAPYGDTSKTRLARMVENRRFRGAIWFNFDEDSSIDKGTSTKRRITDVIVQRMPQTLPTAFGEREIGAEPTSDVYKFAKRIYDMARIYLGIREAVEFALDPNPNRDDTWRGQAEMTLNIFRQVGDLSADNVQDIAKFEPLVYYAWLDVTQRQGKMDVSAKIPLDKIENALKIEGLLWLPGVTQNVHRALAFEFHQRGNESKKQEYLNATVTEQVPNPCDRWLVQSLRGTSPSSSCPKPVRDAIVTRIAMGPTKTPTVVMTPPTPTSTPTRTPTPTPLPGEDRPCDPPSRPPTSFILLQGKIAESDSTTIPNIFAKPQIKVSLQGKATVCIASTPDGKGALKVDDQIELFVTRVDRRVWVRDFYDPITKYVKTFPSQDVSWMFGPGDNEVLLVLTDLRFHKYSAEPIWLVIWE